MKSKIANNQNKKEPAAKIAIRHQYERLGVESYYSGCGADYRNPHEAIIHQVLTAPAEQWSLDLSAVLDLACGSGEVTLALQQIGCGKIDGIDPFTGQAYLARTGMTAESFSFEQIAEGALAGRHYKLIVCSFALHLIDVSWLPALLSQLKAISSKLLIITPHKRPAIKSEWGWRMEAEMMIDRVRARLYMAVD